MMAGTEDWRARRQAMVALHEQRQIEVDDLEPDEIQEEFFNAWRNIHHWETRVIIGHCWEVDPEDDEELTLCLWKMIKGDLEEDDAPHRYGPLAFPILRTLLDQWVIPALASRLGDLCDQEAEWYEEYETDPQGDSVGEIFACCDFGSGDRIAHKEFDVANETFPYQPWNKQEPAEDEVRWKDVLEYLEHRKVSRRELAEWAISDIDLFRKEHMTMSDGLTIASYCFGELHNQIDKERIMDWFDCEIPWDLIMRGLQYPDFDTEKCCVMDLGYDAIGDYPHITLAIDCSYESVACVVDEDAMMRFWNDICEDREWGEHCVFVNTNKWLDQKAANAKPNHW